MSNHFLNEYICVVYLIKIYCFVFLYMLTDCRHAGWVFLFVLEQHVWLIQSLLSQRMDLNTDGSVKCDKYYGTVQFIYSTSLAHLQFWLIE
jgi:hypothetical protein